MAEKRFTYIEQFNGFCDVFDYGKILTCMRLEYVEKTVGLLNNFQELSINDLKHIEQLQKENEQLKQQVTHLTMYKNLFREFQKQLDGVKKKSDLDSKDFEDLIELTKGHVFDDEHDWIHLPVNDR